MTGTATRSMVERGDARIEVYARGSGPLVVLPPSLGRGARALLPEQPEAIAAALIDYLRQIRY